MIDVLIDQKNERTSYVMDFIFRARGLDYHFLFDSDKYLESKNLKLNYSSIANLDFSIGQSQLLLESTVEDHDIKLGSFEGEECISFDGESDPLASIFFVLTRYEEYQSVKFDEHGRFPYEASCLSSFGWIEYAVCDRWAEQILRFIGVNDHQIVREVRIVPTFDIDNTFAYKHKSGKQKILSQVRDLIKLDRKRIRERKKVRTGEKDPYDTFDFIERIGKEFNEVRVFWLVGDLAPKDRNLSLGIPEHQRLIQRMAHTVKVGLHPSYASNGNADHIRKEKERLAKVLDTEVIFSRQHYLRFRIQDTFASLIQAGIKHDYSMGFAEVPGFRSGTARAHAWFDLNKNEVSELIIHPFVYMDGTLNEYLELSIEESKNKIAQLHREVVKYGGDFVFIWHNETIGDYGKWEGWSDVLNYSLNLKI